MPGRQAYPPAATRDQRPLARQLEIHADDPATKAASTHRA
jgi:hypothetical protein